MKLSLLLVPALIASWQPYVIVAQDTAPSAEECAAVTGGCQECVNAGCAFISTDLLDDAASGCVAACNDEFGIPIGGYENAPACFNQDVGSTTDEICAAHQEAIQAETDCRGRATCEECTNIPIGSTTSCYWASNSNMCTSNSTTSDAIIYCPGTLEHSCTYEVDYGGNPCEQCLGFGCTWSKDGTHQSCTAGFCDGYAQFCYNTTGADFQGMEIGAICTKEAALTADDLHCSSHFDCEACHAATTESTIGCWWAEDTLGDSWSCKAMPTSMDESAKMNMTCPVSAGGGEGTSGEQGQQTTPSPAPSSAIMHASSWFGTLGLAAFMVYYGA